MGHILSTETEQGVGAGALADRDEPADAAAAACQPADDRGHIDIFVSYESNDSAEIIRIVTATFEARGLRVFNPVFDLVNPTAVEMERHVARASLCVVAISPNYFRSKWCCIEARAAMRAEVQIIPVFDGTKYAYAVGNHPSETNPMFWKAEHEGYHLLASGEPGEALRNYVFKTNLLPAISDLSQASATRDLIAAVGLRVPSLRHKLGPLVSTERVRLPQKLIRTPPLSDDSDDDACAVVAAAAPKDPNGPARFDFELEAVDREWGPYVQRRHKWINKKIEELLTIGHLQGSYVGCSATPCGDYVLANFDCKIKFPSANDVSFEDQETVRTIIGRLKYDLRKEGVSEEDLEQIICLTGWIGCLELVIKAPSSVLALLFQLLQKSPSKRLPLGEDVTLKTLEPMFRFSGPAQSLRPIMAQLNPLPFDTAIRADTGALVRLPLLRFIVQASKLERQHQSTQNHADAGHRRLWKPSAELRDRVEDGSETSTQTIKMSKIVAEKATPGTPLKMDDPYDLNEERYIGLLEKLIGEAKYVQNQPPKFVPEEDRVIQHILALLEPHSTKNGGPLHIQHLHFKEKRGNLIIEYRSAAPKGTVAFVGSHLDVVPADPEGWDRDPFKLTVEGDKLYGRGTTDCLGHVALVTEVFLQLAENKPALDITVFGCFIASEETSSIPEVGVDMVLRGGHLDGIKNGPVFWIDAADSEPCIGTAAAIQWSIRAEGKLFHSGLPHKGINALELCQDAVTEIQRRFYTDFPPCPEEEKYRFATPSTMKPTKIEGPDTSLNQVPPWCIMEGDIRLTPFYKVEDCKTAMEGYVADINANITKFAPARGTTSKYEITEEDGNVTRGKVKLEWIGEAFRGIACSLDSPGYHAIVEAHKLIRGDAKPYSITGSLPLVGDLQDAGFDLQISGYGKSSVYHGDNEYCSLSEMKDAHKILTQLIVILNKKLAE